MTVAFLLLLAANVLLLVERSRYRARIAHLSLLLLDEKTEDTVLLDWVESKWTSEWTSRFNGVIPRGPTYRATLRAHRALETTLTANKVIIGEK